VDRRATDMQPPARLSLAAEPTAGLMGDIGPGACRGDTATGQRGARRGLSAPWGGSGSRGRVSPTLGPRASLPCSQSQAPPPRSQPCGASSSSAQGQPARRERSSSQVSPAQHSSCSPRTHTHPCSTPGPPTASCSDTQSWGQPALATFTHLEFSRLFVQECSHLPTPPRLFAS